MTGRLEAAMEVETIADPRLDSRVEEEEQPLHIACRSQILDDFVRDTRFARLLKTLVSQPPESLGITKNATRKHVVDSGGLADTAAMMLEPFKEQFPFLTYYDIYALAKSVATEVESGLEAPAIDSATAQGGDGEVMINIDLGTEATTHIPPAIEPPNLMSIAHLAKALLTIAVLTLGMVIATTLYKPARGVFISGRNKHVYYYITLAIIFVLGLAEALVAFWWFCSGGAGNRRHLLVYAKVVLCCSVGPLVAIIGIGGFASIQG